jgi:hypothetical protein
MRQLLKSVAHRGAAHTQSLSKFDLLEHAPGSNMPVENLLS